MMVEYRHNSHSVIRLSAHIVWVAKYRYHVLKGDIQVRCQKLLVAICNSENVKVLKDRTSHHLQQEFPDLQKRYWGQHFWGVGYGAWSTGLITAYTVQEYLAHHKERPNNPSENWILEK